MRHILLAATAFAMLGGVAYAQDSISGSNSTTNVNTSSGSTSQSTSNPRVNVIGNPIGNGASSSYSGAKSSSNSHSNSRSASVGNASNVTVNTYAGVDTTGSGDPSSAGKSEQYIGYGGGYTVRNVPEVIPPSVVGGNPCAVGASGGLAVAGFGIAGGGTWADKACERRQQAALLFNMGEQKIAVELMCQDDNIRSAMRVGGKPCTADVAAAVPPAPVAQARVAPATAQAPAARVMPVAAAAPPKPTRPEWCYTAAPAELRGRAVCDLKS